MCLAVLTAIACFAQPPALTQEGIRNAASHIPTSLPSGALAPGERLIIRGVRFQRAEAKTQVLLETASGPTEARLLRSGEAEIEVLVPAGLPIGDAKLTVRTGDLVSRAEKVRIAASSFGIYTRNSRGWGPGEIDNMYADGTRRPNALGSPATPGQIVEFRGTGLSAAPPEVFIGNQRARVDGVRRNHDGYDTFRAQVPAGAPLGCFVPVLARTAHGQVSNTVTIAISADGSECHEEPNWLMRALDTDPPSALILPLRGRFHLNPERRGPNERFNMDVLVAGFYVPKRPPKITLAHLLPPPGSCTAYTATLTAGGWQEQFADTLLGSAIEEGVPDGGNLRIAGNGKNAVAHPYRTAGSYETRLAETGVQGFTPFFEPGPYTVTGGGTKTFTAPFQITPEFDWTNRDHAHVIDRRRPLKLEWRASSGDAFLAVAFNVDVDTTGTAICICNAAPGARSLTIPAMMLANFPVTRDVPGPPLGILGLLSYPAAENSFKLGAALRGVVFPALFIGQAVKYR